MKLKLFIVHNNAHETSGIYLNKNNAEDRVKNLMHLFHNEKWFVIETTTEDEIS